jgi:hypothetical protein
VQRLAWAKAESLTGLSRIPSYVYSQISFHLFQGPKSVENAAVQLPPWNQSLHPWSSPCVWGLSLPGCYTTVHVVKMRICYGRTAVRFVSEFISSKLLMPKSRELFVQFDWPFIYQWYLVNILLEGPPIGVYMWKHEVSLWWCFTILCSVRCKMS